MEDKSNSISEITSKENINKILYNKLFITDIKELDIENHNI